MSNPSSGNGNNKTQKRNLPSWMSSSESGNTKDAGKSDEDEKTEHSKRSTSSSSSASNFSKLLEGVVFLLSGFVNPERSTLRSKAIEMGAAYQADWNSDCTLLVCAFPNTPKFRQVEADCGTIISKEWILESYNQKKLVDIENYLMHAGKPWRKRSIPHWTSQEESPSRKSQKVERGSRSKPTPSTLSKNNAANIAKEKSSPTELKKWAADDLNKTLSWLASQEEKPEQSEIKHIAAEGILTCLQDAIDSLEQKQDVRRITEQWQCVPRAVEELSKLEAIAKGSGSRSKGDLCRQAKTWKRIYEEELQRLDSETTKTKKKKQKTDKSRRGNNGRIKATENDAAGSDSEETMEMTEDEIELAYQNVTS